MTWIKTRRLILFAVFLLAAAVCTSIHAQTLSNYKVVWGINGIGDNPDGALILDVAQDGAVAKAGILAGDIITAVDGSPIKNSNDLKEKIKASQPYTLVNVKFQQAGKVMEKTVLPRGFLRLEIKDFDRSFVIPGMSQTAANRPSSALDALDNINVLKQVIIDPKSGQIALVGTYDPKYATGPIPYLDLLKTAIKYPEPKLNLTPAYDEVKSDSKADNPYGIDVISTLLGMPAAERERQTLIRAMAASYGITPEEYVAFYNYAFLDSKGEIAPPEIGRIFVKICHNAGLDDAAAEYKKLEKNTDDKSKVLACIAIMEKLGLPAHEVKQLRYSIENNWKLTPADMLTKMYKLVPIDIKDKNGRPLTEASMVKVPIGDAATRILCGVGNGPLLVKIEAEDIDPNTNLVRIMYEADYAGKTFILRPDLFEKIPGQKTYSEYTSQKIEEMGGIQTGVLLDARFWFEPKRVEMKVSPDKKVISFGAAEISFTTNFKEVSTSGFKSKEEAEKMIKKLITMYNDWCAQYTNNYELYAQIFPSFHSLRESAKMVALAKWLNSEKISVNLDNVKPEKWSPPEKMIGYWRSGVLVYKNSETGKYTFATYNATTGGVTFKPKNTQWTAVESTTISETGLPDQLKLSSQLGEKAVEAAHGGDIENARYLSELSAQAMTGEISRGDLIKLNVPLAEPVQLPATPEAVLLQKEMIKQTYNEINELSKNPTSKQKTSARLDQIGSIYNTMRSNPASASDYLHKLQTGQLSTAPGPATTTSALTVDQELLKNLYDTIHKRTAGTNEQAQGIIRSLKTNKPPMPENINKHIDELAPGDVILVAPVPFKDLNKANYKDVLISNSVNLIDRWGSKNWSSPASHVAVFLGEKNGKRWYMDNTSEHGPVIKEEQVFLKQYTGRNMDVATLVGEPISPAEADAIFKAAHELREMGITFGIGDKKMVCSEASRWLIMQTGRYVPAAETPMPLVPTVSDFIVKEDVVKCSPADFYDRQEYFLIRPLDIQRK